MVGFEPMKGKTWKEIDGKVGDEKANSHWDWDL